MQILACAFFFLFAFTPVSWSQGQPKLSDAEVAHTAVLANRIDIQYAAIAKQKSRDPEVLKFAETMTRDHQAVIAKAAELANKLGVTPKDNAVSKKMQQDADKVKKAIRAKSAKAFDKAYIDNEVLYHQNVIAALDGVLIPETENSELKAFLQGVLPALRAHLEHARMLQEKIKP